MECSIRSRSVFFVAALSFLLCPDPARAQEDPGVADLNAKGVESYNARRWDEAIHYFARAYESAPTNPTVRRNLCNAYQAQANELARAADFATAAELLELAISVDPENASPLAQLGSYYLRLDMIADAVFRLEEAVELDPTNTDALELLGDAYYRNNNLAAALEHWEAVREKEPNRRGLTAKLEKAYREESVEYNFSGTRSTHFEITFKPGTSGGDVSRVLQVLERAYRDIGRRCGGVYPPAPIHVTVYTADDFARATQMGEHVGAVYDGKIRVPLRDTAGTSISDDELTRRLYHEYTHVVVRFWAGSHVPWWLNEGLAETFSRSFTPQDAAVLDQFNQMQALFPLKDLESGQLKSLDADALDLAYRQSHAAVSYLWDRYGQRGLANYMNQLAQKTDFEQALIAAYRLNYDLLQREVAAGFTTLASRR